MIYQPQHLQEAAELLHAGSLEDVNSTVQNRNGCAGFTVDEASHELVKSIAKKFTPEQRAEAVGKLAKKMKRDFMRAARSIDFQKAAECVFDLAEEYAFEEDPDAYLWKKSGEAYELARQKFEE